MVQTKTKSINPFSLFIYESFSSRQKCAQAIENQDYLNLATELFTEMKMTWWLEQAEGLENL